MSFLSAIPIIGGLFDGGSRAVERIAGTFRENSEAGAQRSHDFAMGAQSQYAAEFHGKGWFNQLMDGVNRIPRPFIAIWFTALVLVLPVYDPILFGEIMASYALVPDFLWQGFGVIMIFFFGGRMQAKSQQMNMARKRVNTVVQNIKQIRELRPDTPGVAADDSPEEQLKLIAETDNPAVTEWAQKTAA